jgi:hypothetical protein
MECNVYNIAVGHGTGLIKLILVHDNLPYALMVLNPQDAQRLASQLLLASNKSRRSINTILEPHKDVQ